MIEFFIIDLVFITLNNFKSEDTLKISNTGTSQRPYVATATAATLIGTAIGKDVFELSEVSSSGAFTTFKVGGAGYMKMYWMKKNDLIKFERGQFMEVRDTFLTSIISWGICKF